MEIEAVCGSKEGSILADGRLGLAARSLQGRDERSAVVAAPIEGQSQALIVVAGEADIPVVLVDALQRGARCKAQVTGAHIALIEMVVNVVDCSHAALFAASPNAGLHAQFRLRLTGRLLRLVLSWQRGDLRVGVAART